MKKVIEAFIIQQAWRRGLGWGWRQVC